MTAVFPSHRSVHPSLCPCCGKEENGKCLGVKRRKLMRLVEAVAREERKVARGGPKSAGLVASLDADANILRREVDRIVKMERERDEAWS